MMSLLQVIFGNLSCLSCLFILDRFVVFDLIYCPGLCLLTDDILFQQVGEEKLWLADETVLAHFRALKLESHADASVCYST